jgi:hypothetical protein
MKTISQNADRYSKVGTSWVISASPDIKPINLPIGVNPTDLLPILEVDGIIVEVGEYKLISQKTLNLIKDSNNPHYDLNKNGEVKGVPIGQTIPHIKINTDTLHKSADERTILNRNAGVSHVDYIYDGNYVGGTTLSQNLVSQINYTLNPDINRPKDTYIITDLQLSPDDAYTVTTANALDSQDLVNNIFSYSKLSDYLNLIKEKQILLQKDFNTIKEVFYEGKIPPGLTTQTFNKMATAEDEYTPGDVQIIYKSAQPNITVVASPPADTNVQLPKDVPPEIKIYSISGKLVFNSSVNTFGGTSVFKNDPTIGNRGKQVQLLIPGSKFIGQYYKDFKSKKVYKVYDSQGTSLIGYIEDGTQVVSD